MAEGWGRSGGGGVVVVRGQSREKDNVKRMYKVWTGRGEDRARGCVRVQKERNLIGLAIDLSRSRSFH